MYSWDERQVSPETVFMDSQVRGNEVTYTTKVKCYNQTKGAGGETIEIPIQDRRIRQVFRQAGQQHVS